VATCHFLKGKTRNAVVPKIKRGSTQYHEHVYQKKKMMRVTGGNGKGKRTIVCLSC